MKIRDIQDLIGGELEINVEDIISTDAHYTPTYTVYSLNYSVRFDTGFDEGSISNISTLEISKKEHDRIKKIIKNRQVKKK